MISPRLLLLSCIVCLSSLFPPLRVVTAWTTTTSTTSTRYAAQRATAACLLRLALQPPIDRRPHSLSPLWAKANNKNVDATTQNINVEMNRVNQVLNSLKSEVAAMKNSKNNNSVNSSSLEQRLDESDKNFNSKIDKVNQKINNLKSEVAQMNKMQRLEWAIQNYESSIFRDLANDFLDDGDDRELVLDILLSFRQNCGHCIPDPCGNNWDGFSDCVDHDDLSQIVYFLTGTEPKIQRGKDGYFILYCLTDRSSQSINHY